MPYAHKLQAEGARNVIISCGGYGSLLLDEEGGEHVVPSVKVRLVNTTGSGDSMVAGFIGKVHGEGSTYGDALRFASACGTATAASKGIAKRATIDRVYEALCEMMNKKPRKSTKKK
jgi:1-phosphofructokinase